MKNIETLSQAFKDKSLYELALTHKSWVNEHKGKRESNERLEFLGDAILEFIISREIFNKFKDEEEGFLTALRANLVNTDHLYKVAKKLGIGKALYLSHGEEESGGRENPSLLADTVEAIIGAFFIDQGLQAAENFIFNNILVDLDTIVSKPLKDAKSRLQELVQSKGLPTPKYEVVKEDGPDHAKKFTIQVKIGGKSYGEGRGKNKSEAAQDGAKKVLEQFL